MRRRDLFRGAGSLAVLAAPVVAGCAAPRNDPAGSTTAGSTASTTAGRTASVTAAATTTAATNTAATSTAAGGAVVRGAGARRSAPAAVQQRLLPAAAALYRAALPGTGNAILSPYSIVSALGMLAYGARGATAAALTKALGGDAGTVAGWLTGSDAALAAAVTASKQAPGALGSSGGPTVIDPANAFLDRGARLNPPFLDALARGYGVGVRQVDFAQSDAARAIVNGWVGERTRGLIPELIPAGFVDASTLLVLVNAIYLKAAWVDPFRPATGTVAFRTATGKSVAVELMTREDKMNYVRTADWEAVSIPLAFDLAMTVIVPRPGSFAAVAARLDAKLLAQATSGEQYQVKLAMPGFRTDTATDLESPLRALGLGMLFAGPDLSGIAGAPGDLFVSGAVHQAKIGVDHLGVEAAAATAVAVALSGLSRVAEVEITRPFLYLIHDTGTTTPLFLGRVTDPTA